MIHVMPNPGESGNIDEKVGDEVIVTFKPRGQERGLADYLRSIVDVADKYEIVPYRVLPSINACVYKVPEGKLEEIMEKLNLEPGILYAEYDIVYRIMGGESALQ